MAIVPVSFSTALKYKFIYNKTKLDGFCKGADPPDWQRNVSGGSTEPHLSRKVKSLCVFLLKGAKM